MPQAADQEITRLLQAWSAGEQAALEQLIPLVYDELHKLAHRYMRRERPDHTLQTTALVNEAYLRLVDLKGANWQNRVFFYALCARLMRQILVDFARSRRSLRRGGEARRVSLDEAPLVSRDRWQEFLSVDEALKELAGLDPRKSQVVELRFFGGLSVEEIAQVLQVHPDTVARDWRTAKAWLMRKLNQTM